MKGYTVTFTDFELGDVEQTCSFLSSAVDPQWAIDDAKIIIANDGHVLDRIIEIVEDE